MVHMVGSSILMTRFMAGGFRGEWRENGLEAAPRSKEIYPLERASAELGSS